MTCPVCKSKTKGTVCRYCELEEQLFATMLPGQSINDREFYARLGEMAEILLEDVKRGTPLDK